MTLIWESSRTRYCVMMRENGGDHIRVVDKASLPWRPQFDSLRMCSLMMQFDDKISVIVFFNTEY
jgi:hypothetical protein